MDSSEEEHLNKTESKRSLTKIEKEEQADLTQSQLNGLKLSAMMKESWARSSEGVGQHLLVGANEEEETFEEVNSIHMSDHSQVLLPPSQKEGEEPIDTELSLQASPIMMMGAIDPMPPFRLDQAEELPSTLDLLPSNSQQQFPDQDDRDVPIGNLYLIPEQVENESESQQTSLPNSARRRMTPASHARPETVQNSSQLSTPQVSILNPSSQTRTTKPELRTEGKPPSGRSSLSFVERGSKTKMIMIDRTKDLRRSNGEPYNSEPSLKESFSQSLSQRGHRPSENANISFHVPLFDGLSSKEDQLETSRFPGDPGIGGDSSLKSSTIDRFQMQTMNQRVDQTMRELQALRLRKLKDSHDRSQAELEHLRQVVFKEQNLKKNIKELNSLVRESMHMNRCQIEASLASREEAQEASEITAQQAELKKKFESTSQELATSQALLQICQDQNKDFKARLSAAEEEIRKLRSQKEKYCGWLTAVMVLALVVLPMGLALLRK